MFYSFCSIVKKRSWVCYWNWNVMCHVPKYCSMIEAILVLSSGVSLFQGEMNLCWDSFMCADYLSVLISLCVSFERGSTECLFKLRRPQHLQESITTSCLAIRTGQCQVPPHETTCLPGVTWDHYTLSGNISHAFLLRYANKEVIKYWRQ